MTRAGQVLMLLKPTRTSAIASVLVGLLVGVGLWCDLGPEARHASTEPWTWFSFSPDAKSLICASHEPGRGNRSSLHLIDISTATRQVLCKDACLEIVFSPDGEKIAGIVENQIHVWHRKTCREFKRYPILGLPDSPKLGFSPEGDLLVIHRDHHNENHVATDIETGKTRNLTAKQRQDFFVDQEPIWTLTPASTPDGKWSALEKNGLVFVVEEATGNEKQIPASPNLDTSGLYGITHDGTTVIVRGRKWGQVRRAFSWISFVFFNGEEPDAPEGVFFLDVDTGRELAFLEGTDTVGISPNGTTFLMYRWRNVDGPAWDVLLYDLPLRKPWSKIFGGALLALLCSLLFGKAWQWLPSRRKSDEIEDPRAEAGAE